MTVTRATAPGKIILFGEHAVVYGQPAIAAPVSQVRAYAEVRSGRANGIRILAPDLGLDYWLADTVPDDPLVKAILIVQERAGIARLPGLEISVRSEIPIASGLGSGAATAAALIRALARYLGRDDLATGEQVAALTYEVEKIHHGTPSGIDNTVVALERPVYFVRTNGGKRIETFRVATPLTIVIGDTGRHSHTRDVVGEVRRRWQANPSHFDAIFRACGRIAVDARAAIEAGNTIALGALMQQNHKWLQEMTVSSPELDRLVLAATEAGALGAKLSGAGRGGNMIALVDEPDPVSAALRRAGASRVLVTTVA